MYLRLNVFYIVNPISSIEYPGTRSFDQIFEYSNCRVIGSSNRVSTLAVAHAYFIGGFLISSFLIKKII